MKLIKLIAAVAITLAIATAIITTRTAITNEVITPQNPLSGEQNVTLELPSKRLSRFLAEDQERNPRAADHCHKNPNVCTVANGYSNSTVCCNNKCIDLHYDNNNCGRCKNKCRVTQSCCRGQCVYLALDKRHCGKCNHRCATGNFCDYGLCQYA